ncbi:hypothetical protein KCP73_17525 [Salmonella enterica subsp. enterica]|nr:hypothetical protein KCP73_17525 [Salmonella enterica subsp. enterica]
MRDPDSRPLRSPTFAQRQYPAARRDQFRQTPLVIRKARRSLSGSFGDRRFVAPPSASQALAVGVMLGDANDNLLPRRRGRRNTAPPCDRRRRRRVPHRYFFIGRQCRAACPGRLLLRRQGAVPPAQTGSYDENATAPQTINWCAASMTACGFNAVAAL